MTLDEVEEILEKVRKIIDDYRSYHTFYCAGEETWGKYGVSFVVFGFSDQGEGSEWRENWSIDTDGKIFASEQLYENFEEFEKDWI